MGHLPISTPVAALEVEAVSGELESAVGQDPEDVDGGVAAEEPAEAGAAAAAGRPVAGDEPAAEVGVAGECLVEIDLGPLECQIELRVGRDDRGSALTDLTGVFHALDVVALGVLQQPIVDQDERVPRHDAAGDDDWDELGVDTLAIDSDPENRWRIGCGVGWMRRSFRGERRADVGVVLAAALREDEAPVVGVVVRVLAADPSRPHEIEIGLERRYELQRRHRADVQQDDYPRLL